MLRGAAKFHHSCFNNLILIAWQCPHATRVAGYQTWQDLGRQIRKGEMRSPFSLLALSKSLQTTVGIPPI
ncbi:ArdC-like ssDNA-binding domain-containing protein [Lyngbya confervoides]|uniref:ArdC-like ssDNA-binding domain-containing protein n=1 Tax=Lyngbya confervoides TaxID=207921 RepID=UPI00140DA146